jgi:hypothetical protein
MAYEQDAQAARSAMEAQSPRHERIALIQERIVLESVEMNISGQVATAMVRLREHGRAVSGRAVGRNLEPQRLALLGDAAARALTELLPLGYGVLVADVQPVATEAGEAVVAAVTLLTPEDEATLLGVARADDGVAQAAVRAVLDAVNRRLGFVFADAQMLHAN